MELTTLVNIKEVGNMNERFHKLGDNEQKKILNSAYQAFTDTPYEKASTNRIVIDAGISKGKLFYYFKDKKTLFNYLVNRGLNYIKNHYIDLIQFDERDFLKRYLIISQIKKKAYEHEPALFDFMSYIYLHEKKRISATQQALIENYQSKAQRHLKENVDISLFRDDIEPYLVMKLLEYSLEGYQHELTNTFKDLEIKKEDMTPHYKKFETFVKTLRKIYYK